MFGAGFPGHPRPTVPLCCPCHPPFCPALPALATPGSASPPLLLRSPLHGLQAAKENRCQDGDSLGTMLPLLPACWLALRIAKPRCVSLQSVSLLFFSSLWLKEGAGTASVSGRRALLLSNTR